MKNLDKIPTRKPTAEVAAESEKGPTKHKKSKLKLQLEFINEIISNEKAINDDDEIFRNYFTYQNPSFLGKDFIRSTQAKNEQLVCNVKDGLID